MSSAAKYDDFYYLSQNGDVLAAVISKFFKGGAEHFGLFGAKEQRAPNEFFLPTYYASENPDVVAAIDNGLFESAFHHYQLFGEIENRVPSEQFEGFDPASYLAANPDVAASINNPSFISALHHFIDFGRLEGRLGSGIGAKTFALTNQIDQLEGSHGDDIFLANPGTIQSGDQLDGKAGKDSLAIFLSSEDEVKFESVLPIISNFSNLEKLSLSGNLDGKIDFSNLQSIDEIELGPGTTVARTTSSVELAMTQSLSLTNVKDGDNGTASLLNGGLKIIQPDTSNSLSLIFDDVGLSSTSLKENLFIDIAGKNVDTLNIQNINENFIILENSSGKLNSLNLVGSGIFNVQGLPATLTSFNGVNADSAKVLKTGSTSITIRTDAGSDFITLTDGSAKVETGRDDDAVHVLGGSNHSISTGAGNDQIDLNEGSAGVFTGLGDDSINVLGGSSSFDLEGGDDLVNVSGGVTTINTGDGLDSITISGGTNIINTLDDADTVNVSGGTNTLNTGSGNDNVSLTGGVNFINTGTGNDTVNASGGASNVDIRSLVGGGGDDTLNIVSTGTVTLPTFSEFEQVSISDTVHQSLNFSFSSTLTSIELDSGTTIDGATITTTLGEDQSLVLDSITDGDTSAASLSDGGIIIAQANSISSLDLTLDDVGPATSIANENVFIDIAGVGVSTVKVTSDNDSFVVISNSGGALTGLELLGTGTMALGTLPTSITNVNGAAASANLTLTIGTGTNTIIGGTGNDAITLTGGTNDVQTGDGDDIISTANNLVPGDRIDGGNGNDTFEVIHTGLATIPSTSNLISIENISIQDTVHQTLDFSSLTSITGIELDSGTTINGATINTTLGTGQSLKLDSITDGDTAAASLADGGIRVSQPNSVTSLDLTLDDIGPASANTNENVFLDIAGTSVTTVDITSANDSFVVLENSGSSLATINISGSGALGLIGSLANSITTIDANSSSTNLTLTTGTAGTTVTGGSGNDSITLSGGTNNVTSSDGDDTINLGSGNDTVNTGSGDDNVVASAGTNNITTGSNNDQVTISGGSNTVNTGNNNDIVNISNGNNNINSGSGNDQITVSGGTNTIVTGNNNDTVNASGGNNDIDTDAGNDQVVLTGGTNDVNTGSNNDTVTLSGGTDTVDMGSGNDTVIAGANLSTSDTVNGGGGTGDTLEITAAMTDALAARLSNFEILEIKGGGGITHDVSDLTGLTSLKASAALTGALVITDLAEAAEVDISAALGNDLTVNQINSAGGSDTLAVDFSGGGYTTGGSIIAPNIETVTIKTSSGSTKVMSGGTFANAVNVIITASSGNLTITDLTAINITALDASSSNNKVNITTGADVFAGAFTFSSGSRDDTLDLDGATLVAGSVFELGGRQDTLTLNSDAVATVVRTSVTDSNNAFSVRDDATTANTPGFTSGSDTFDYNGSLSHDSVTSVVAAAGATLQAAVGADSDATVYVIQDANGDSALESAINDFANSVTRTEANTLEIEAVDTGLLSYTGLDSAFDSSDIVLIAIDSETNEDAALANNGGTAVYRFQNTDTSTVDTVLSTELELIGVFQDAALGTGDFV